MFLAYEYGFLMVVFVSLCSLGGVFLVPLIKSSSETGMRIYDHVYAFMVAIAISALVSDAVLHLIPHVSILITSTHNDVKYSVDYSIDDN